MNLSEMIGRRKSCRSFTGEPVADDMLEKIKSFSMQPLYPDIAVHWEIVSREQVKCICPWTTPQLITIYSEEKDGYLEYEPDRYGHCSGTPVCIKSGYIPVLQSGSTARREGL